MSLFQTTIPPSAIGRGGATTGQCLQGDGTHWAPATITPTTPGGSSGDLQYNNAGSFAGIGGTDWNGTVLTVPTLAVTDLSTGAIPYAGAARRLINGPAWNNGTGTLTATAFVGNVTGSISGGTVSGTTVTASGLTASRGV